MVHYTVQNRLNSGIYSRSSKELLRRAWGIQKQELIEYGLVAEKLLFTLEETIALPLAALPYNAKQDAYYIVNLILCISGSALVVWLRIRHWKHINDNNLSFWPVQKSIIGIKIRTWTPSRKWTTQSKRWVPKAPTNNCLALRLSSSKLVVQVGTVIDALTNPFLEDSGTKDDIQIIELFEKWGTWLCRLFATQTSKFKLLHVLRAWRYCWRLQIGHAQ